MFSYFVFIVAIKGLMEIVKERIQIKVVLYRRNKIKED